jgi:hypothetical protein
MAESLRYPWYYTKSSLRHRLKAKARVTPFFLDNEMKAQRD